MTKKKQSLSVDVNLSDIFAMKRNQDTKLVATESRGMTIPEALESIITQMEAVGRRERTILDYRRHVGHFTEHSGLTYISDVTADHLYAWLSSMNVNNQTKLTRLKCLKAFLSRCFDNGWLTVKTWKNVHIKADSPAKKGATESDVQTLLTLLDLTDFVQLRDATAIMTMFQTGIRIGTVAQLRESHVDLKNQLLRIPGDIVKNHEELLLPFDEVLAYLLTTLIRQNLAVREDNRVANDLLFITKAGTTCQSSPTNSIIGKRITKYAKKYGLKNVSPHALRRGFAMRLRKQGAHISLISKALGHSDIAVTTRYLRLDKEEVADNLRNYL